MNTEGLISLPMLVINDFGGNLDNFVKKHSTITSEGKSLLDGVMDEFETKRERNQERISPELKDKIDAWLEEVNKYLHLPDSWKDEFRIPKDQESDEEWIGYRATMIRYSLLLDIYTRDLLPLQDDLKDQCELILPRMAL